MTEAAGHMPIPESSDPSPKTPSAETTAPPPGGVPEMPNVPQPGGLPPVDHVLRVNLHLDDLLFDPERGNTLSQAIVEQAAEQLLDGLRVEMITQARAQALSILNARLSSIIEGLLAEAVEKAVQGTDSYGNPKGEPTTLHEFIVARADKVLRERTKDRSGFSGGKPLIEAIIEDEVISAFRKELVGIVAEARESVLAAVKDQAAQIITDTIAKSVPR